MNQFKKDIKKHLALIYICLLILPLLCTSFGTYANPTNNEPCQNNYLTHLNPVAFYGLDAVADTELVSGTMASISGNDSAPIIANGASSFTGNAIDFNSTNNSLYYPIHQELADAGNINTQDGFSVSFWYKSSGSTNATRLVSTNVFEFACNNQNGINAHIFGGFVVTPFLFDGNWHHFTAVVDFNSNQNNVKVYVDGTLKKQASILINTSYQPSLGHNMFVGARTGGTYPSTSELDDIVIFDQYLAENEVKAVYNGGLWVKPQDSIHVFNSHVSAGYYPAGVTVQWSQLSGPGTTNFANVNDPFTTMNFSTPGTYNLNVNVSGYGDRAVTITVLPKEAPVIVQESSMQLPTINSTLDLAPIVSVPGKIDISGTTYNWSKVSGPSSVNFTFSNQAITQAQFGAEGLYTIRLEATNDGLTGQSDVTVLVGAEKQTHYALLLEPLYLVGMEGIGNYLRDGATDMTGRNGGYLDKSTGVLPQLITGARPFTGYGWDFRNASTAINIVNRGDVADVGIIDKADGLSVSFWLKGDNSVPQGVRMLRLPEVNVYPIKFGNNYALRWLHYASGGLFDTPSNINLFDNTWHHIVYVLDYNESVNNIKVYIDGNLENQSTFDLGVNFDRFELAISHRWGKDFPGLLDDIAVFDRNLSVAEISYLFNGPDTQVLIDAANRDPLELNAGPDQAINLPQQSVQLQAVSSEPNTTYQWKLVSGPGAVSFNNPNVANPVVSFGPIDKSLVHNTNYLHYIFRVYADSDVRPGDRDEVEVVFYETDAPQTRQLSANPPTGVHPRVLFSAQDLPEIKARFFNSSYNQIAGNHMQQLYNSSILDPTTNEGLLFNSLLANNNNISIYSFINPSFKQEVQGTGSFYSKLAGYAFLSMMRDDTQELQRIATVFSNLTERHLEDYSPSLTYYHNNDVNPAIGLCYDWLYNYMTAAQQTSARKLLSLQTRWRQAPGVGETDLRNSSNGYGYHSYVVINSLAIEGEEGHDPRVEELVMRSLRRYMTQYGIMPSGYPHEGAGYFSFSMINAGPVIHALSRRGENLYGTTNFYANQLALFYCLMPGQNKVFGHGDTVEGVLDFAPGFVWQGRHMFPNDKLIAKLSEAMADYGVSKGNTTIDALQMSIFGDEKITDARQQVAEDRDASLNLFCPDKGYVNTRNDWSDKALMLSFRSGIDKFELGHNHPDVNSFEVFSHGVEWFSDQGKFASKNDMHQTILVDGLGGGGSTAAWTWPSLPGQFYEYIDNEYATGGISSAKNFYTYTYKKAVPVPEVSGINFNLVDAPTHGLTWGDFAYEPDDVLQDWRTTPVNFNGNSNLHTFNPMNRANRTALLVKKEEHPFVVIADDYQKDAQIHDYTWVANPRTGKLGIDSTNTDELILTHVDNPNARMLVKVLQAEGLQSGPQLLMNPTEFYLDSYYTPVVIKARSINPKFKVLLYPYEVGDPQPEFQWHADSTILTVAIGDELTTMEFVEDTLNGIHVNFLDLCDDPQLWSSDLEDTDENGIPDFCDDPCIINSLADAKGLDAGVYTFDFGDGPFQAYVDDEGWVLCLQYHHSGGTNPARQVIPLGGDLPIYDPSGLGTDNSLDPTKWGHASQAFAASIPDASIRLRWYGETSAHNRVIHFESTELGSFKGNSSVAWNNIATNFNPMPDHTAFLPGQATHFWNNRGDSSLTEFPFFKSGSYHWGIRGLGNRWEVDNNMAYQEHTIHRIWVKGDGNSDFTACTESFLEVDINVALEGAYNEVTGLQSTQLLQRGLLPSGQPFNTAPWNYNGTEGQGWTITDYPAGSVDWVLVSLRTEIPRSSEVARAAGILLEDGAIFFPDNESFSRALGMEFYIVVQHRNHIAAMSPTKITVVGTDILYDFRNADGYTSVGAGQKYKDNTWMLYAGDGDQLSDPNGYDINGNDGILWNAKNGTFNQYLKEDYNMDGEASGADKIIWSINNGVFSTLEK